MPIRQVEEYNGVQVLDSGLEEFVPSLLKSFYLITGSVWWKRREVWDSPLLYQCPEISI